MLARIVLPSFSNPLYCISQLLIWGNRRFVFTVTCFCLHLLTSTLRNCAKLELKPFSGGIIKCGGLCGVGNEVCSIER